MTPNPRQETTLRPDAALDPAVVRQQCEDFSKSRANRVARNAVTSDGIIKAARNPVTLRTYQDTYSVKLKVPTTVTNQEQSGRCWLFATLNSCRARMLKALDVEDFEFSQAYLQFYEKMEWANAFLVHVVETADKPLDDRAVAMLFDGPADDGGQWNYGANLVAKYGLVPKSAMPETACSANTGQMVDVLNRLLRKAGLELRQMATDGATQETLDARRAEVMDEVHRVLCVCLTEPPTTFDFVCEVGPKATVDEALLQPIEPTEGPAGTPAPEAKEDEEPEKPAKRLLKDPGLTPQEFAEKYVKFDLNDYVELVDFPLAKYPYEQVYGVEMGDRILGGLPMRFLNMPIDVLEDAAIASLKAGEACYFACDVMKDFPSKLKDFPGTLALDTMDIDDLFDVDLTMDKAAMLESHESGMTHAMTLEGVQLGDDGRPVAWRVENSWGKDSGKDGFLIMSGDWFRLYAADVAVRREFVSDETLKLWDTAPTVMTEPWSIFY